MDEYGPGYAILTPGWMVGSLASLESAGVDAAELTCWKPQDCDTMMDGLFTTAGTPQMPYWVLQDYANVTGQRLATTTSGTNLSTLATRNDASTQVKLMVGRHDACGTPPRPSLHAGLPAYTCPQYQPPLHSPVSLSLSVIDPYPASRVRVTLSPLPNSAQSPDGSNPVPQAPPPTTTTLPVVGGSVSIPLATVGDGDAFSVVISPAA